MITEKRYMGKELMTEVTIDEIKFRKLVSERGRVLLSLANILCHSKLIKDIITHQLHFIINLVALIVYTVAVDVVIIYYLVLLTNLYIH